MEQENRQLRSDVDVLNKSIGLLCPGIEMSYRVVGELQKKAIPVGQSCRLLEVSRSGYYDARRRPAKPLLCKTRVHLKAAFAASHQSYGRMNATTK